MLGTWMQLREVCWGPGDLDTATGGTLGSRGLGHSYGRCVGVCWGVRRYVGVQGTWTQSHDMCGVA